MSTASKVAPGPCVAWFWGESSGPKVPCCEWKKVICLMLENPMLCLWQEGEKHLQINVNKNDGGMGQPESLCPPPTF